MNGATQTAVLLLWGGEPGYDLTKNRRLRIAAASGYGTVSGHVEGATSQTVAASGVKRGLGLAPDNQPRIAGNDAERKPRGML